MAEPQSLAADVARALDELRIDFIVVGASALAICGFIRGTLDVDFMTTESSVLAQPWDTLVPDADVEVFRGDFGDPLIGTVRFSRDEALDVDIVVGKSEWPRQLIERSPRLSLGVFDARVPTAADLILLKIGIGSDRDDVGAADLIAIHGESLVADVDRRVRELPDRIQQRWSAYKRRLSE